MTDLLSVKDVRVRFPNGTEGLTSVSFRANQGEIIGIIGRSGAGKSTLLRCINGFQSITSGEILLHGNEVHRLNQQALRKLRRQIGFIWQEHNVIERLPTLANVLTARLAYNQSWCSAIGYFGAEHRRIAVHNLERLNLVNRARLRADKLSGGEKQRLSIARALTQEPDIILADEPVASLDPELSWQVLSDLSRVTKEDGLLTIMTLHQVHLAREFADRIIGIADGRIVFDGSPGELNDSALMHIYGSRPQISAAVESMPLEATA